MPTQSKTSYLPFARKYRPDNFAGLYGQEVLAKVVSQAIINNRLAQSYLLTGIRGVGKTTSARIIARTINCSQPLVKGSDISPCGICKNCCSVSDNNHPDIIEIDAASQTGVDDIKTIIRGVEYKPLLGKYKVFIIDEIHMLSKAAFNALLKTIEEPPAHVVFIFATTEVQKIPATVISRCQRYDLRRLTFTEISSLLKEIIEKEGLNIEDDALRILAYKSEGSARDAVSMMDQALNLSIKEQSRVITAETVNRMLGIVDVALIVKFTQHIINNEARKAIELVNEAYLAGFDLVLFIESVSDFLAYLSKVEVLKNDSDPIYLPFSEDVKAILASCSFFNISILWQIFSKAVVELKASHNQLIAAEMLVLKAVYANALPSIGTGHAESVLTSQVLQGDNEAGNAPARPRQF